MPARSRSRSRSPDLLEKPSRNSDKSVRRRSRSPRRYGHHHRHRTDSDRPTKQRQTENVNKELPLGAAPLSKDHLRIYRPMFALYLDIQKSLYIEDLAEDEVRGRWKSFVGKWNRGELAEGWYDPATLQKAISAEQEEQGTQDPHHRQQHGKQGINSNQTVSAPYRTNFVSEEAEMRPNNNDRDNGDYDDDDDDDDFGPSLPKAAVQSTIARYHGSSRAGPAIPTIHDLRTRHEQDTEDAAAARENRIADLRAERKADRQQQKERLDELAPRAEAGSRERMLEQKKLAAESNRAFAASANPAGEVEELKDSDVMGDDDSLGDLKRIKKEKERKKNERELRREEMTRSRIAEREDRVRGLREKENKTMDMLRKIAQARFGPGDAGLDHG